jgi:hypothetical protein
MIKYCCVCNAKIESATRTNIYPLYCEDCKKKQLFTGTDTEVVIHNLCETIRVENNTIIKLNDQLKTSKNEYEDLLISYHNNDKIIRDLKSQLEVAKLYPEVFKKYDNVKVDINRWNTKRIYTKEVNEKVNEVEIRHNCGCCSDSPIEIWPYYLEDGSINIYCDPIPLIVGNGNEPNENWQQQFIDNKIPQTIINRVSKWFKENKNED